MEMSEQIIAVFDNLAQKFGVVIDWGQENVIPYIQKLCTKYITWEISTSIAWICFGIALIIAGCVFFKSAHKWHDAHKDDIDYEGIGRVMFIVLAILCWAIALLTITTQTFDIIKCCTFPELQIFEFVRGVISCG